MIHFSLGLQLQFVSFFHTPPIFVTYHNDADNEIRTRTILRSQDFKSWMSSNSIISANMTVFPVSHLLYPLSDCLTCRRLRHFAWYHLQPNPWYGLHRIRELPTYVPKRYLKMRRTISSKSWWQELNLQPSHYKCDALPIVLHQRAPSSFRCVISFIVWYFNPLINNLSGSA